MNRSLAFLLGIVCCCGLYGTDINQTATISPILPVDSLPFRVRVEVADFSMPSGLHSFGHAIYKGKWVLIGGRTNGLHHINPNVPLLNGFPPQQQNTVVYVIDSETKKSFSRSLHDPTSGLSQHQIDLLSVTNAQSIQVGETLYYVGGYGVDTATGQMNTKPVLTAIDIPGLIEWVKQSKGSAAQHIRHTIHPLVKVSGGALVRANAHQPFLLTFGQNFDGFYSTSGPLPNPPPITGIYTYQVRPFQIIDNGKDLYVKPAKQPLPDRNFRRRDLNVVSVIEKTAAGYSQAFWALSGVFFEDPNGVTNGAWTVPVKIAQDGEAFMPDPSLPNTFKQGMNNYECARVGLFSKKNK